MATHGAAQLHGAQDSTERVAVFRLVGSEGLRRLNSGDEAPMDGFRPLDPSTLAELGLEEAPIRPEFFLDEAYVVVVQHHVLDAFLGTTVHQVDVHCLARDWEPLERALEIGAEASERLEGVLPVVLHAEVLGRESLDFERLFVRTSTHLTYFEGREMDGFAQLEEEGVYEARLLRLFPPVVPTGMWRAAEVPCDAKELDRESAFLLDCGSEVCSFQAKNNPAHMMQATLLAQLLGKARGGVRARAAASAPAFRNAVAEASKRAEEVAAEQGRGKSAPRAGQAPAALRPPAGVKSIWCTPVPRLPEDQMVFDKVGQGNITQIMLSKAGDDKVYVIDAGGAELFVYTYGVHMVPPHLALATARAYCEMQGYPAVSSCQFQQQLGAVNIGFDNLFEF